MLAHATAAPNKQAIEAAGNNLAKCRIYPPDKNFTPEDVSASTQEIAILTG